MIFGDNGRPAVLYFHHLHPFLSEHGSYPVLEGRKETLVIMEGVVREFDMSNFFAGDATPGVMLGDVTVLHDERVAFVRVYRGFLVGRDMAVMDGDLPHPCSFSPAVNQETAFAIMDSHMVYRYVVYYVAAIGFYVNGIFRSRPCNVRDRAVTDGHVMGSRNRDSLPPSMVQLTVSYQYIRRFLTPIDTVTPAIPDG